MLSSRRMLTMLSVLLLLLASGLAVSSSEEEDSTSSSPSFTDQWAVHINGGDQVANAIAARHGFTNLGKVYNKNICIIVYFQVSRGECFSGENELTPTGSVLFIIEKSFPFWPRWRQ